MKVAAAGSVAVERSFDSEEEECEAEMCQADRVAYKSGGGVAVFLGSPGASRIESRQQVGPKVYQGFLLNER